MTIENRIKITIFPYSQVNILYQFLKDEKVWYY